MNEITHEDKDEIDKMISYLTNLNKQQSTHESINYTHTFNNFEMNNEKSNYQSDFIMIDDENEDNRECDDNKSWKSAKRSNGYARKIC